MNYLSVNITEGPSYKEIFNSFFKNQKVVFTSSHGEIYIAVITLVSDEKTKLNNDFSALWIGGAIYKLEPSIMPIGKIKKAMKEKKNKLIDGLPPYGGFVGLYSSKQCGTLLIKTEEDVKEN